MKTGKIISLIVIVVIAAFVFFKKDDLAGRWEPLKDTSPMPFPPSIETIDIRKIGLFSDRYTVLINEDEGPVEFKRIGDDLIMETSDDQPMVIHFYPDKGVIVIDPKNVVGLNKDPNFYKTRSFFWP